MNQHSTLTDRPLTAVDGLPVVVVGAGPVGSILALELARHGVRSILVERRLEPSSHPKMDFVNSRSMEFLHRLGLADRLWGDGVPTDQDFRFIWTASFGDDLIADWSSASVDDLRREMARVNDGTLPRVPYLRVIGSRLEQITRRACLDSPLIDLRLGTTFEALDQDGSGVTVTITDETGRSASVRGSYLVGCDGSGSRVRDALGIHNDEIGPVSQNCNVYFRSNDPRLLKYGRFFLSVVGSGVTLVTRDGGDTWTGVFPRFDGAPFTDDPLPVLWRMIGLDFVVDEVLSVANWENRLAIATTYREGRAFIAGDSAHQFFPSGGHGANTGIGDAIDLGWKLAATLSGWADPDLLLSYEIERRPVAQFNREMCFSLMEVWRRFIFLNKDGATSSQIAGYLHQQKFHANNLGIHLGYRYRQSPAICPDTDPEPAWHSDRLVASSWSGSRAPSMRKADGTEIYDLLGPEFTLLDFSRDGAGESLAHAASSLGVPLCWITLDEPLLATTYERALVLIRPDHHVAWRGDEPPADAVRTLAGLVGR